MTRLFGTNGIRGIVGKDMTASLALDVGSAVGTYFDGGSLAVGNDTRTSGPMLKAAAISGLAAAGCSVEDVGVAPSPAIQYYVGNHKLAGGVIITASHNPREFNGIKVLDSRGMELARSAEEEIEDIYSRRAFRRSTWDGTGSVLERAECNGEYLRGVMQRVDVDSIRKAGLKVALDCANGASTFVSPYLLRNLGCSVASLNAQPDGTFPGHPPEPVEENVGELKEMVVDSGADLGAVHDGDADRVIFVNERGEYVHGDRSLAIVAGYLVGRKGGGTVVTPVSSSSCVEDVVKTRGGHVLYTKVGAPVVARTIFEEGAIFGGEENGGLIFPEHQYCRDGAMGVATMLELLASSQRSLSEVLAEVPKYYLEKSSVSCPHELKKRVLEGLLGALKGKRVETLDGAKVHYQNGWVLVRPSGTEAVIRVFSEARTAQDALDINAEAVSVLRSLIEEMGSEA